jgi:glutamate---cysteine ligase / carboxylate-amine ligase
VSSAVRAPSVERVKVRTVGVEEEFLLLDPSTGLVVNRADAVVGECTEDDDTVDRELLRHQVETRTEPATDLDDVRAQLVGARRRIGEAAREAGTAAVATGTAPFGAGEVRVSPKDRYRAMVDEFGEISREAGTCGMHVHVGIESREEGVGIIDRLRPWLPVVLALSVNSPYAEGRDSGYASWRSQVWSRWPTAGVTELFGDPAAYDALVDGLIAAGAARDAGMVYFEARLSAEHPTVEVRVADVCTDVDDALVVAATVRAIAATAAAEWAAGSDPGAWRSELLRAAAWRAGRYGLAGTLVHPVMRGLAPVREVLASFVERTRPALVAAGDLDLVRTGFERLLGATGAARQRAAFERSGSIDGVVADLVARTEATWEDA